MVKIDMEMPKTCGDCPFVFYAKNCALRIKVVELNKKPDWCPLIEESDGEWKAHIDSDGWNDWLVLTCSICGAKFTKANYWNYCPNCGAKLELNKEF